jgi:hypothetical protein
LVEVEIPDRIAIQNSGDLTNAQTIATGGSFLIPELRRFNWILVECIAHSPRFKSIADNFKSADLTDKRLRDIIRMINNSDIVQVKKDSGFPVADIQCKFRKDWAERRIIFLGDIFFRSTSQEMHLLLSAVQNPLDQRVQTKP